jgi:hypothetical protein
MTLRFTGRTMAAAALVTLASVLLATPAIAGHLRPQGATPFRVPLVPAYLKCATPNTISGVPLAVAACQPPSYSSNYLQIGTPDVNLAPAQSIGYFRVAAITGDASFQFNLKDVRCRPATVPSVCTPTNSIDGEDYVGEVQATFMTTITSHDYPPNYNAGTTVPVAFPVTIPCASTATNIGSTCAIVTTYNALIPGVIKPSSINHRAVWEYSQVQVNDGGSDGVVATAPNTLFMVQGMFFP